MWKDLSKEWKEAFSQSWIAFQNGSIPIGAVITDEEGETLQAVQLAQQGYHELRKFHGEVSTVLEQFQKQCPKAIKVAIKMYGDRYLDKCVENNVPYSEVFDEICRLLEA